MSGRGCGSRSPARAAAVSPLGADRYGMAGRVSLWRAGVDARRTGTRPRGTTMSRFRLTAAAAVSILAFGAAAAGGMVAARTARDEKALQPTRQPANRAIESRVNSLLAQMTLEEKLEQIQLLPDFLVTEAEVRNGLGSVLSVTDPARIRELQRIAVEESRLKIPLLFAFDTIHGFRTVFPIPLGVGASFDPQVAFDDHTYGAREPAAAGPKQP